MEEKRKMTEAEILEERRFIESFDYAMAEAEKQRKDVRNEMMKQMSGAGRTISFCRSAMDELKSAGNWNAEFIAAHYVLILEKKSTLSKRQRDFIMALGPIAKQYHYEHYVKPEEEAIKDEKHEVRGANPQ